VRCVLLLTNLDSSDKKTATTFNLVFRPQNDPLIHDESAPDMVLAPVINPKNGKGKGLSDLASELGSDAQSIRDNEGEAANHGIFYDDTEYDYMQHVREIGKGGGQAVFVEAKTDKAKAKQPSLEDSLRQLDLQNQSEDLLDKEILPSKNLQKLTYQAQQEVPDAIAGFQPDMDPRLREVLEALEDDAYVEEDDDIFQELTKNAQELPPDEFDESYDDYYEDDGWESDHTAKPDREYKGQDDEAPELVDTGDRAEEGPSGNWMEDFKKFKNDQKAEKTTRAAPATPSEIQSSIWTTTTNGGRKKKRAGAMTNPSTYSMTSSSLVRTEHLGILDARFEKLDQEYNADFDDMASVSAVSTSSTVQGPLRSDFDGLLDEFLDNHTMAGKSKRRVKKGKYQSGIQELDDIRKELGPARLRPTFI